MIQDDDNIVLGKADGLVDQVILDAFERSYVNGKDEAKPNPYREITGLFRVVFSSPLLVVPPRGDHWGDHYYIRDHVISVAFYEYEYERMMNKDPLVHAGVRDDGSEILERPVVWKTKNNFALKLRQFGANIQWMNDVEYGLEAIYDDTGQ